MKTEVRERLFLPLMLPLGVLAAIVVIVGLFAAILLWNTREAAVALAIAGAGGVLFAVSMLSSRDDLDVGRKTLAIAAGAIPVLIGAGLAFAQGGVDDPAALNINRQPHAVVPEDAPVIVAVNEQDFETEELTLAANAPVGILFDNQQAGISHNVQIFEFANGERGAEIFQGRIFPGPEQEYYEFDAPAPGEAIFICTVHPAMEGNITFSADSENGLRESAEG